jgi:hypothetical protein
VGHYHVAIYQGATESQLAQQLFHYGRASTIKVDPSQSRRHAHNISAIKPT